ncbi:MULTISPECIES: c-type cytochrome [Sphingobacterium]|uniref:c-type cytochrome n=1 Tax=Sphingobacterium TaxID=28453 RepID=UPI002579E15D|nr:MULTISPECIES: hypothetical protein [Sphingobacterium]
MLKKLKTPITYDWTSRPIVVLSMTVVAIALTACTKKQAQELSPDDEEETVTAANVSYINFAKALFETKCSSCHAPGRGASAKWTFSGYSSVKDNSTRINNAVLVTKSMPIGGSLTVKEIELLDAWIKRNTPEN